MNCPSVSPRPNVGKPSIWLKLILGLGTCLLPAFVARPAWSAERLNLSYGLVERSIEIDSLERYARTGKVDDQLATYAQYADQAQLNQVRRIFLTPIPLDRVAVSQFLYTPTGERLLETLGEVIQTDSNLSGFYAIRASLILAASDKQGLTLLNVLRKFPSRAISINLARSLQIAEAINSLVNQTQNAIAAVKKQASTEATTTPAPRNASIRDLRQPGSFRWSKQSITLNDTSRQRKYPADIYLPTAPGSRPVIVISHGLGSDRTSFAYLAEHLASYGFVVAVPEHPGSSSQQLQALLTGTADQVTSPREFIDRPLDVKYLLDELTRLSASDPAFQGRMNLQQVGVVGQSFGGYTALALAGANFGSAALGNDCPALENSLNVSLLLQCLALSLPQPQYDLSDVRVQAAIAINPVDSKIMGKAGLEQIKIPVTIISSSVDTVTPALPEQIQPFTWLTTPNKYLALIDGGTHFSTIAESPNSVVPVPERVIGPSPLVARRYVRALSLAFFQTYVAGETSYRPYLSASYANAISQQPLPLSLVRSLSSNQLQQ